MRFFGPADEFLKQQQKRRNAEKWASKLIDEKMSVIDVEILKSICTEHPTTLGLEVIPGTMYGQFITGYRVTLFYQKASPEKLEWVLFLFAETHKKLTQSQNKVKQYVMETAVTSDISEHPENSYQGPEPLRNWYKEIIPAKELIDADEKSFPRARLPLMSNMKLSAGDDWPFNGLIL